MRPDGTMTSSAHHGFLAAITALLVIAPVVAAATLLAPGGTSPAWASGPSDCPGHWNPTTHACTVVTIPGPSPTPGPSTPPVGGSAPAACHDKDGSVVPCTNAAGLAWWGAPHYCYAEPENPQDPPPKGHENENGKWWQCQTGAGPGSASYAVWWSAGGNQPVDGKAVATQLEVSLPYELANASIAPPPTYHTYISYKNWMWIPASQWHSVSASSSQNGATVTLTATPSYTQWDMGNGDTVSCVGPGREWVKGMPEDAPTNCSYAYKTMKDPTGDKWTVSARINYTLAWTCTGNCGGLTSGDLPAALAAAGKPTSITVLQRQTVVTN